MNTRTREISVITRIAFVKRCKTCKEATVCVACGKCYKHPEGDPCSQCPSGDPIRLHEQVEGVWGERLYAYPYMDSDLVCVTGMAYQGSDLSFDKPDYTVNWPSIGNTPENAQKFAAAILAACEWVEEKKEEHENAGSIKS